MDNQEWSNLGEEIKNLVQNAVDSRDFQKLNETIGKTIQVTVDGVNKGLNQAGKKMTETTEKKWQSYDEKYKKAAAQNPWKEKETYRVVQPPKARIYKSTNGLTAGGLALSITGYTCAAGLGIGMLATGLTGAALGIGVGVRLALGIMTPLFLGSGVMAYAGTKMLARATRFKSYVAQLRDRTFCSIKELSGAVRKSENYVRKDLSDMIRRRMFIEGHLDQQQTCLMVTQETYQQYQTAQEQLEERQRQERLLEQKNQRIEKELPEEAKKVIADGNEFIKQIRECNDAIPGEEISEKISRMEAIVNKIFARVECQPEVVSDLRKFMGYYLPTTVKLLHAYQEMDAQPAQGPNIVASKKEIEGSLDTINEAFENLLDSFFQDKAMDISSDISVLQTMLAQEGLTGSDFQKSK